MFWFHGDKYEGGVQLCCRRILRQTDSCFSRIVHAAAGRVWASPEWVEAGHLWVSNVPCDVKQLYEQRRFLKAGSELESKPIWTVCCWKAQSDTRAVGLQNAASTLNFKTHAHTHTLGERTTILHWEERSVEPNKMAANVNTAFGSMANVDRMASFASCHFQTKMIKRLGKLMSLFKTSAHF